MNCGFCGFSFRVEYTLQRHGRIRLIPAASFFELLSPPITGWEVWYVARGGVLLLHNNIMHEIDYTPKRPVSMVGDSFSIPITNDGHNY
jgi:hypothetical protein